MKKIIIILILTLIGCNKNKESIQTKKEKPLSKEEKASISGDIVLEDENEKIAVIAIKNKMPIDSAYLILHDYYSKTNLNYYSEIEVYEKIIDSISKDLKTPKEKVASLIFEFEQGKREFTE